MTTKLKIDLNQGILEVEGSETFVKTIYQDFKEQFLEEETVKPPVKSTGRRKRSRIAKATPKPVLLPEPAGPAPQPEPAEPVAKPELAEPAVLPLEPVPVTEPKKSVPRAPTYIYVEDLELGATADHPSLVEFMDSKLPITNEERNLVFLYYLQHIIKRKPIKLDDIYTCYREGNIRAPINIENSLRLTANNQNWINIHKNGNMTVTSAGKLYVEQDLPKKAKSRG